MESSRGGHSILSTSFHVHIHKYIQPHHIHTQKQMREGDPKHRNCFVLTEFLFCLLGTVSVLQGIWSSDTRNPSCNFNELPKHRETCFGNVNESRGEIVPFSFLSISLTGIISFWLCVMSFMTLDKWVTWQGSKLFIYKMRGLWWRFIQAPMVCNHESRYTQYVQCPTLAQDVSHSLSYKHARLDSDRFLPTVQRTISNKGV